MKIAESELILNADGSIYHLHLHPEQVSPLIITVGDPDRVAKVSRYFDRIEHKVRKREFVTHTGWLGKTRLTVISTGIGTDNIDIVMNELDALFNIDLDTRTARQKSVQMTIIRLGTSGGIQPETTVDSFVLSRAAFGFDGLLRYYNAPGQCNNEWLEALGSQTRHTPLPCLPYFAESDKGLVNAFKETFMPGLTATNTGFYAPQGRFLRAKGRVQNLINILQNFDYQGERIFNLEMETAGIYGLSQLLGHRAISLSAILANRADGTFSKNPHKTERILIETALEKISTGI